MIEDECYGYYAFSQVHPGAAADSHMSELLRNNVFSNHKHMYFSPSFNTLHWDKRDTNDYGSADLQLPKN